MYYKMGWGQGLGTQWLREGEEDTLCSSGMTRTNKKSNFDPPTWHCNECFLQNESQISEKLN